MFKITKKTKFPRGTKFNIAYPDITENNWDYKNNDFEPDEITYGTSRKKVSLICDYDHMFQISPANLSKGQWCGVCAKINASETAIKARFNPEGTFEKLIPGKVKYWSNNNKRKPNEVMAKGDTVVFMVCDKGHEFDMTAYNIYRGQWCPYCSGRRVCYDNSFGFKNPDKVRYWSKKNDKSPYEITASSEYRAEFICDCDYKFTSACKDINLGRWCANCAKRPKLNNSLIDLRLQDRDVYRKGNYVNARTHLEFVCKECHFEFKSYPDTVMNKLTGCPRCKSSKGEKRVSEVLRNMGKNFESEYSFDGLVGVNGGLLRFDFCVKESDKIVLIEYDGEFHFNKIYNDDGYETIVAHDKIKNNFCDKNNIKLIRIPYWDFNDIENVLINNLS